jgi:hypothetical protein
VPAFIRVEPAIASGPGVEPDSVIGLAQQRRVRVVGDPDRERARGLRFGEAGEGEGGRPARRHRDHDVIGADIVLADQFYAPLERILRSFDRPG